METVHSVFGSGGALGNATSFAAGLECEVEAVQNGGEHIGNFKCVPDNSLRNKGCEYVTRNPKSRKDLVEEFTQLYSHLKLGADPFSERTSTHVHVNVSSMTTDAARHMVLLYALFEEFFFAMVKPIRRDNIHCVPLTETHMPDWYNKEIVAFQPRWHKYTALNLKRMGDLGTMEFRHLHGTKDSKELDTWLHVLENLWKLAQRVEVNEHTLSSKQMVTEWFEAIFFPADKVMMLRPSLFDIIRNSLIDVKFSTIKQ